jgi:hypothetical protein
MRQAVIVGSVVVVAALIAVAVAAATGTFSDEPKSKTPFPGATGRPAIVAKSTNPLIVSGTGFKPRERVRVGMNSSRRTVVASGSGSFSIRFKTNACGSITVTAVGNHGSRASFNISSFVC